MNQILVTKKLYITPELKKKKKAYKLNFIISVFFLIVLLSAYIYAAYDRDKLESESQSILANIELGGTEEETDTDSDVLIAILNSTAEDTSGNSITTSSTSNTVTDLTKTLQTTSSGYSYYIDGKITIPSLGIEYPILDGITDSDEETEALLKISPVKFHGPEIHEVGNYCIVGHNYRNSKFFSKVPTLEAGDVIQITNAAGKTMDYVVYTKYTVVPTDVSCTSQNTNGNTEITLITCTDDSSQRVIVKARAST